MNIRHSLKIFIFIIVSLLITSQLALSQGIKERMKLRLPAIAALKTQGIIGENNQGYLGFVAEARAQEDVVTAENKDRKMVYTYFAKQQNTTLAVVEEIQAQRKAEKAKSGEFFQKSDGVWVKK